ncbi:DUF2975 domain-containing protein [Saccharopolyspora indica]|uniref:DUF2975 domain-containing protein n=1 Tax=Saccharopolyspora indica TaxID=1229659 RepID=UPI0022EB8149|nr:DUF2975 domain-containing protein [Saccharopolyspora indica]MDA3646642.1 DUF2975 domain-containing protein [Saccharopolyspora indica]
MHSFIITALRIGIVGAIAAGLFGQIVVIPTTAADEVELFPPYAPLAVPYATAAIIGVACVQIVLVAAWMLLAMVQRDAIFSSRAFRWVDAIIGATLLATLVAAGVAGHLAVAEIPSPDDGMAVIGALGAATACVGVGASFAMVVVIMRNLLRKATEMKTEIAGVI